MRRYFIGDDCVCWSLGDTIDQETSRRVLGLYRRLKNGVVSQGLPVRDIVPSYNALAVYFDPASSDPMQLIQAIEELIRAGETDPAAGAEITGKTVVLPVVYDGEDMGRVASLHGLTVEEVARRHAAPRYLVALVGFKPHFPYLIGLDRDLVTPRLGSPRTLVPAGSVAIGGAQTGVYPEDSPGGWNILGRTDPARLTVIEPGDTIVFEEVGHL